MDGLTNGCCIGLGMCPHGAAAMKAAKAAADLAAAAEHPPTVFPNANASKKQTFDYEGFYYNELDKKHKDKSYRYFNNINRLAQEFPRAHMSTKQDKVTVWCSNDYVGFLCLEFSLLLLELCAN